MQVTSASRLDIPDSLRQKILDFRRRVWCIKTIEAVAGAVIGVFIGYLLTYSLDRLFDTPRPVRWMIFAGAVGACSLIPLAIDRWVWRRRRLDQLARLLSLKHPSVGDQLLGIIELAESESEQARSRTLVEAAIRQVAEAAQQRDFENAVPNPRHRSRSWVAGGLIVSAIALLAMTTAAATNAWARFLAPWSATPRYTFAAIEPLPKVLVVPHGEAFEFPITLAETTEWKPDQAEAQLAGQAPIVAFRSAKAAGKSASVATDAGVGDHASASERASTKADYRFEIPPQLEPGRLQVNVGDFRGEVGIRPMLRPELSKLSATVVLPEYLGRPEPLIKDIRGGVLTAVKGSQVTLRATVSRELVSATMDGLPQSADGPQFSTKQIAVVEPRGILLDWKDRFGLGGKEPFKLTVTGAEDEAPSIVCEGLPRQRILLDSEVLAFQVRARDDFGVRRVGIEWQGIDPGHANPAKGETIIGAGNSLAELLELAATFSATQFEIEPQPVAVRVFVEDYLPGRERVYSPTCYFDILNAEEHAIWITEQLSRWHRMALDVRDRELQLYETNKALRSLPPEELDLTKTRQRIEAQAAAERTNGRRLSQLVTGGEELLKQAMRNPEIGVGHLERWAEMMQILKDIAGNRMPSVADLLKQGAEAPKLAQASQSNDGTMAGQIRSIPAVGEPKKGGDPKPPSKVPSVVDIESSVDQPKPKEPKPPSESTGSQPSLRLPVTTLAGRGSGEKNPPPAAKKVEEAVKAQEDLLAEFEKIVDELNQILANLEGSTLVKRLKAASRRQYQVATKLGSMVAGTFGIVTPNTRGETAATFAELAEVETDSSQKVSNIMDDMSAYFERSRLLRFKMVLDDMREQDVTAALRALGDDLRKENGLSISQAEYWSDTLDRWAEDLVDASNCGACPGCKSKGSLPPSIVLEVLQILEGEVNLREQTRVAEQARPALPNDEYARSAGKLSQTQDGLRERVDKVVERIRELPDAENDFGKEIALLRRVSEVMEDATGILAIPETGSPAIGAETEAIELLLQSKRCNPNGGGGGGANPGGGGGGDTVDSALALVGSGVNDKEVREDHGTSQATGASGPVLPEEFRAGLDEYFNRLENR